MNRQEIFDYIVKNNLKEEVKKMFGRAYNSVSTTLLEDFINTRKEAEKVNNNKTNVPTDRKGLKEFIKKNKLEEYIKEYTGGKNYTIVSTESLSNICDEWSYNQTKESSVTIPEDVVVKTPVEIRLDKMEKTIKAMAVILNLGTVLKNLE